MIGISNRLSVLFLAPSMIKSSSLCTLNLCLSRLTLHPSSHSCPSDARDELVKSGSTIAVFPLVDNRFDVSSSSCLFEDIATEFGSVTFVELLGVIFLRQRESCSVM